MFISNGSFCPIKDHTQTCRQLKEKNSLIYGNNDLNNLSFLVELHTKALHVIGYSKLLIFYLFYFFPFKTTSLTINIWFFWFKYDLDSRTTYSKFDPIRVWTHDLPVMDNTLNHICPWDARVNPWAIWISKPLTDNLILHKHYFV